MNCSSTILLIPVVPIVNSLLLKNVFSASLLTNIILKPWWIDVERRQCLYVHRNQKPEETCSQILQAIDWNHSAPSIDKTPETLLRELKSVNESRSKKTYLNQTQDSMFVKNTEKDGYAVKGRKIVDEKKHAVSQHIGWKILIGLASFLLVVGIVIMIVYPIYNENSHEHLSTITYETNNQDLTKNDENTESEIYPTATPTPIPTETATPVPTLYPLSAITSHMTDREPYDIGEYKRPAFTRADATSFMIQKAHPEYDNSPKSLIDRDFITSWQDGLAGDGSGEQIVIAFDEEHLIHYLEFKLGNWRTLEYYNKNNRPKEMVLTIDGTNFTLDFTDAMIPHYVEFDHPVKAAKLTFTINSVYRGTEANDCCIAEITAFTE